MKVLDSSVLNMISGGKGDNGGAGKHGGKGSKGAPNTCANQAGATAIIGAMTGIPGGPWGVVGMSVAAGVSTAISCANNKSNNGGNNGALGGNSNSNSVNGQCRW